MAEYKWALDATKMSWDAGKNGLFPPVSRNGYYSHFYSGSDAFFFIVNDQGELIPIPVVNFGYGVSQEKVPLFGAWDYTFRAVARGTRIVRGEFSLVFSRPNYIGQLLGKGKHRDAESKVSPLRVVAASHNASERDVLRAKHWGKLPDERGDSTIDESVSWYNGKTNLELINGKQEAYPFGRSPKGLEPGESAAHYAGHPAFDIMISHGNNPDYTDPSPILNGNAEEAWSKWSTSIYDHMKFMEESPNGVMGTEMRRSERIYIETVELMSSGIAYDTSGQPLIESYSFIAKDVTTPYVTD